MAALQQEILCVLLETLVSRGLIDRAACDKAKERVNSTPDFPEFFAHGMCCQAGGEENGCAQG